MGESRSSLEPAAVSAGLFLRVWQERASQSVWSEETAKNYSSLNDMVLILPAV